MIVKLIKAFAFILCIVIAPVKANTQVQQQQQLQKDIKALNSRLNREERKANALRNEVRSLEKKLGEQTRRAYEIEKRIKKVNKHLQQTRKEKKDLELNLEMQKRGLSQQLQALYSAGEQSHMRLLLKQDDPSDIGRTVKYFEYLNRSRVEKIKNINSTIKKLKISENTIANDKVELEKLGKELATEQAASKETLTQRQLAYKKIKQGVNYKRRQLSDLKRKEARLQAKIDNLVANRQNGTATTEKKVEKNKNIGKKVGVKQRFVGNRKFSSLRGKLSWPVKGRIIHNYGERRNERQRWKGTVIAAAGGSKVRAIAYGKVEFSGWFNGYGYLIIIRHDDNYRSLYGYNRAIYVKEGQAVNAGATIAAVGNSGGQQQNALYFEIRQGARPRDPSSWCR